jgi:hypothetical protein
MFTLKKIAILILMFSFFAGLIYLSTNNLDFNSLSFAQDDSKSSRDKIGFNSQNQAKQTIYFFNVEYFPEQKRLKVIQKIFWRNLDHIPTNEIYFNLFPNAFLNNKTNHLNGGGLNSESKSGFTFSSILVNKKDGKFVNVIPSNMNKYDSTVAKIVLDYFIGENDTVLVELEYYLKVPKAVGRFGYELEGDFVFFAQWFPRICIYQNGKWDYNHYHPFAEFNYEFVSFDFNLKLPKEFSFIATGILTNQKQIDDFNYFNYQNTNEIDFAWVVANEAKTVTFDVEAQNKKIMVEIFHKNLNESRLSRIQKSAMYAIQYLTERIGEFPYNKFSLVEVPNKDSRIANMEYPSLITFGSQYFSPEFTLNPEETIIHEIVHQYFYATLVNNETEFAWLDEGFANYLTSKILDQFYPPKLSYFKLFGELPIRGLLLLELEQVPLVYSLATIKKPSNINSLTAYLKWGDYVSLTDSSSKFKTYNHYSTHAYARGELFLKNIENMIGEEQFLSVMKKYYSTYKKQRVAPEDFLRILQENLTNDEYSFVNSWFKSKEVCDFKIVSISKDFNENSYNLLLEKEGDIIYPLEIEVHTLKDTLKFNWDGKTNYTNIQFNTKHEIVSAVIDPLYKNLFDKDRSNNSITKSTQFGGALSVSLRFFFWVQNFLMVFGGIF